MFNHKVRYLYSKENNFNLKLNEFLKIRNTSTLDVEKNVFDIINEIKLYGDSALITMINKFDKIPCSDLENIKIENKLLKQAFDDLPIDLKNAMKLASKESFNTELDSLPDKIGLSYSISDLKGREIYQTYNNTPEYYESNTEGQLLDGFKILVNNFQKGDSIHAIIPSTLMFGEKGSFVSKIPAYCPLKIHLRLH